MIRKALFCPWSVRPATIVTVAAGLVLFIVLDRTEAARSPTWGVDEGQRIAESYFYRLLEERAFRHPDWFRVITDSSHPQMNKYFFGLALRVQGVEPPRDLALPRYYESGGLKAGGWQPPPHLLPVYGPMLRPARRAALLCNVLSWMTVTWVLLRWYGAGAALIAAFLFARHYLPLTFYAAARSDALQTCALTLTLLPLCAIWRRMHGRAAFASAVLVGVFSAISFQTRLNGLLALGGAGVVLIALAIRERHRRPLVLLLVAVITCAAVSLLSNPYYWAKPLPAPGLSPAYLVDEPLPLRVVSRFRLQIADLRILLHDHAYAAMESPLERLRFVASVLFSGAAGLLLLGGLGAAAVLLFVRSSRESLMFPAVWGLPLIGVFAVWLPLSWEPYVLLIFPTAVFLAAGGWHALVLVTSRKMRSSLRQFARRNR